MENPNFFYEEILQIIYNLLLSTAICDAVFSSLFP